MGKRHAKTFRYTSMAIKMLEKLISPKFNVEGVENVPQRPVLFVANHFTRSETFILPYIIHQHTKRQVRCLADSGLFQGGLGDFLTKVGTISTKDPKRNEIIVSDLMSGDYDWMIYPEGSMVKSKEIYFKGNFINHTPNGISRTKTGSTVLALKSELYRQELIKAKKENSQEVLDYYRDNYNIIYNEDLTKVDTHIVPVNITYYPIRPGENIIKKFAERFLKRLPKKIAEELEIEGNLILSANINVSFGKAIRVADYSRKARKLVHQIPFLNNKTKTNLVIQYLKYKLTSKFMQDIYFDTKVNLDHLFTDIIFSYQEDKISVEHLKNLIFASAIDIINTNKYRISYSIEPQNLFKIFINEPHEEFDGIVELAKSLKIIKETADGEFFVIDHSKIKEKHGFHNIRTDNTLQVIFNEFSLLNTASIAVKKNMVTEEDILKKEVLKKIYDFDLKDFESDYKKYYDADFSKDKEIGRPFFLDSDGVNSDVGILFCHGYQSAPKELKQMGEYFNALGFKSYGVRLEGHGTAPNNMKYIKWQDWYDSFQRGYAALSRVCSKVVVVGFSTGGLLSVMSCSRKQTSAIEGVVLINCALKLQDIRARFVVPGIKIWNDLLGKFNIKKATLEYVDNNSENPSVNYSRNYLSGVNELASLMGECSGNLEKIKNPALILYSKNDPIVNPKGSLIINNKIKSKEKKVVEFDMDKHIIVFGENNLRVFKVIEEFLFNLLK